MIKYKEIPIFCINLERAVDRKLNIEKLWKKNLQINIQFWKAYDRRDIVNGIYPYGYNEENTIKFLRRKMNHGEIACATSFCMLYEHLINNNYEEVLIIEDDIIPLFKNKKELFEKIEISKQEFPDSEISLLHNPHPAQIIYQQNDIFHTIKKEFSLCKIAPWGNQFFYAKITAIKKLYNILSNMIMPADMAQNILSKNNLVCISNNPMCYHDWNSENSDTYIGNDYRKTNRKFIE